MFAEVEISGIKIGSRVKVEIEDASCEAIVISSFQNPETSFSWMFNVQIAGTEKGDLSIHQGHKSGILCVNDFEIVEVL